MRHFDDVRFITASDAVRLYADRAVGAELELRGRENRCRRRRRCASFQRRDGYSLSAGEILAILSQFAAERAAGHENPAIAYPGSPLGPSSPEVSLESPVTVEGEQFLRTAADVADSIRVHGRDAVGRLARQPAGSARGVLAFVLRWWRSILPTASRWPRRSRSSRPGWRRRNTWPTTIRIFGNG